jgi:lysophospholipase L1-like esterase
MKTQDSHATNPRMLWFIRTATSLWIVILLLVAAPLGSRMNRVGTLHSVLFVIASVSMILASCFCLRRAAILSATVAAVVATAPVRSALLLLNGALTCSFLLYVTRYSGLIAVLFLGALLAFCALRLSESTRIHLLKRTVQASGLSFAVIYAALLCGEFYLRRHPLLVGGGGGGNPALKDMYRGLYSYNRHGLRDDDCTLLSAQGTFRILTVGDSFTFGQGVEHHATYTERLESLLNNRRGGKRYEVLNAGVCGANTAGELQYCLEKGMRFAPDAILLQFYINDLDYSTSAEGEVHLLEHIMKPIWRSYVLFFLRDRLRALSSGSRSDLLQRFAAVVQNDQRGWRDCAAALDRFGQLSRETGVPIILVLFPHMGKPHPATKVVHAAVSERAGKAGLQVVDLDGAFSELPPDEQVVSSIDHHPSEKVHSLAAVRLLREVERLVVAESGQVSP